MSVPEQYRKYVAPAGQRPVYPREVELYDETDPIVLVADPYNPNQSIAVRRSQLLPATPTPPRDLSPQPLIDPQAQRLLAGGIGVGAAGAGLGYGAGQMFAGVSMMGVSGLAVLLGLLLATGRRGRTVINQHNEAHTHVQQKWFGHTDVTNQQS